MKFVFRALDPRAKIRSKWPAALALLEKDTIQYQKDWAQKLLEVVRTYPPERPGSTYQRTNTLFEGWQVSEPAYSGGSLRMNISNPVEYFTFVQGDAQQWYHAETGWKKLSDFMDRGDYGRGIRRVYKDFAQRMKV